MTRQTDLEMLSFLNKEGGRMIRLCQKTDDREKKKAIMAKSGMLRNISIRFTELLTKEGK